jgi:hypothetical protein
MGRRLTRWRTRAVRRIAAVAVVSSLLSMSGSPAGAAWPIALAPGSAGQSQAGELAVPTGVTATCVSATATTIRVEWTALPGATRYDVLQSTTAPGTSGFSTVAAGLNSASWTGGSRASGFTYYYQVVAVTGGWSSSPSTTTSPRTVSGGTCS